MSSSDCLPEDLAKALRFQNAMLKNSAPISIISETISEAIEPRNKNSVDRLKSILDGVIEGKPIEVSDMLINFAQKCQKGMKSNSQTAANMKEILDNALFVSGLSKEDVAKALMVQKALAASGVTPEVLAQAVMFQKALAASGASPEEIIQILTKVCD